MVANFCSFPKILIAPGGASNLKEVVHKHDPVGNETIVSNFHEFANKGMGLNFAVRANDHILLNLNKRSDKRI